MLNYQWASDDIDIIAQDSVLDLGGVMQILDR